MSHTAKGPKMSKRLHQWKEPSQQWQHLSNDWMKVRSILLEMRQKL